MARVSWPGSMAPCFAGMLPALVGAARVSVPACQPRGMRSALQRLRWRFPGTLRRHMLLPGHRVCLHEPAACQEPLARAPGQKWLARVCSGGVQHGRMAGNLAGGARMLQLL